MAYVDVALLHKYIRNELGIVDDDLVQLALDAAEESINYDCQRSFAVAGVATARTFTAPTTSRTSILSLPDFTTVTSIVDNGTTLAATDYQLETLTSSWHEGVPYDSVRRLNGSWYSYTGDDTLTVTATWGWPAVPAAIKQATLILAKDIYASRNAAFGIAAITDFGPTRVRENAEVAKLLRPFKRIETLLIA